MPRELLALVRHDCPTCEQLLPALGAAAAAGEAVRVLSQSDAAQTAALAQRAGLAAPPAVDEDLRLSALYGPATVPAVLLLEDGTERDRVEGLHRARIAELAPSPHGAPPPAAAVSDALDRCGLEDAVARDLPVHLGSGVFAGAAHVATIVDALDPEAERITGYTECIDAAPEGAVMVLAWGASSRASVLGGSAALRAKRVGCVGVVVDGWIRDLDEIRELALPVLAAGTSPVSGRRRVRVSREETEVRVGGVTIRDGDWIVADESGVCVIPADRRDEVLGIAAEIEARDRQNVGAGF